MRYEKKNDNYIPDYSFEKITDITPYEIKKMGVRALAIDLDNTALPYGAYHFDSAFKEWVELIKNAGIPVMIVSNTVVVRAHILSYQLGKLPFIAPAFKPGTMGLRAAAKRMGVPMSEIAMIGDQYSTDIASANRIGAVSIKVKPIKANEKEKVAIPKHAALAATLTMLR